MEKRLCFGTKEYSNTSLICRKCKDYRQCAIVKNKVKGAIKNRTGYRYICPKCQSKNIDWYILDKNFDMKKDYIGKCNECNYNVRLQDRKKTTVKDEVK